MGTRKSRLSGYKQARLIEHFVAGTMAWTPASFRKSIRRDDIEGRFETILDGIQPALGMVSDHIPPSAGPRQTSSRDPVPG